MGAAATAGVSPRELVETLADEVLIPVTAERAPHQREGSVRYTAAELLAERGFAIETKLSALNTDPWDFTVSTGVATGQDAHSASTAAAPAWEL